MTLITLVTLDVSLQFLMYLARFSGSKAYAVVNDELGEEQT